MQLKSICLLTDHIPELKQFYRNVLGIEAQGSDRYVFFDLDGARLSIVSKQGMETVAPNSMDGAGHGGCRIEMEVEDVDIEFERLKALKVEIVRLPTTQPWGIRSVWFRDPDGNLINFFCNAVH